MSRTERLFDLLQILRGHRRPVTGQTLADELGVSIRTLYRDIATLQGQGADIEGEPGLGYVLKPGFMLPPLMFSEEEIEALVLGSKWVADRADSRLGAAANQALAKIGAVLPRDLRDQLETNGLYIAPGRPIEAGTIDLGVIRQAIRREHKLEIDYADAEGRPSKRTIWPFVVGFFDQVRVIGAWCELRDDYRHFRADRIRAVVETGKRYPRRRQALIADWRARLDIPEQHKLPESDRK
ncbi:MAG: YafY family transcriptional regulator [Alphaproteobacteria bacterium]|nr:YafY family transcriptional regulator [Alphaproteobacteria bacterium]